MVFDVNREGTDRIIGGLNRCIGDLEYSYTPRNSSGSRCRFSLDTRLEYLMLLNGATKAPDIIDVIGRRALYLLVCNYVLYGMNYRIIRPISILVMSFTWRDTVEGHSYWEDIHNKLTDEEM